MFKTVPMILHTYSYIPTRRLLERLTKLGWPKPIDPPVWSSPAMETFLATFDSFIVFSSKCGDLNVVSRAMKAIMEPIRIRFQFHFSTDQPTNRLDKPEWYLNHTLQLIDAHRPFIESCLEMEVGEGGEATSISILGTFVDRLADIVKDHVVSREARILQDTFIFLHTVNELLTFIVAVKEKTGVDCGRIASSFFGPYLRDWIEAEREASIESLRSLLEDAPKWTDEGTYPISSAYLGFIELINDLIQTLHNIPLVHARIDFLSGVIIPVFNSLYERTEFDLPAFHGTLQDVRILTIQANSIHKVISMIEHSWGESLVLSIG